MSFERKQQILATLVENVRPAVTFMLDVHGQLLAYGGDVDTIDTRDAARLSRLFEFDIDAIRAGVTLGANDNTLHVRLIADRAILVVIVPHGPDGARDPEPLAVAAAAELAEIVAPLTPLTPEAFDRLFRG